MKFRSAIAALCAAALLAGCAGSTVAVRTTGANSARASAAAAGSAYTSSEIHAELRPNPYFGLLFLSAIAAGVGDDFAGWSDASAGRKPPQLAEDRAITERDCSLPMQDEPSANLRCK